LAFRVVLTFYAAFFMFLRKLGQLEEPWI
jgi:hypothetical protein